MINNKKIVVVLPAYNAEKTLRQAYAEIPKDLIDNIILVDDASRDNTVRVARELGIDTYVHLENKGYGANQKTCYSEALKEGADIIIMLHPDYQYTPKLIPAMASMIAYGEFDTVLASRILGKGALKGGMPLHKYISNRILTSIQNILLNQKLSEYHTGYRAYARHVLENVPFQKNSDDFIFDNQILAQIIFAGYNIGELSCPARYFPEASSINLRRSIVYGLGVLKTSFIFFLKKIFDP